VLDERRARHVRDCVSTPVPFDPSAGERGAKIACDADKIDATGNLGNARTLLTGPKGWSRCILFAGRDRLDGERGP
jgi:hypothetical protein